MKLNISCPATGCQKVINIDDDKKLAAFYGRRMGQEVDGETLGDEFKGYIFKITGGNDKDGFSMKQGVLVQGRVRLLMAKGASCYRPRRAGERKRKSVRGCIVGPDLSVMALAIVKNGETAIAGLTDTKVPKRLGPKRASKIKKLFALKKEDDVRRFVIRRKIEKEGKKVRVKAPRVQRLITDQRLRRKRLYRADKKARWLRTRQAVTDYHKVLEEYRKKKATAHKEEAALKEHGKTEKKPETTTAGKTTTQPGKGQPATQGKGQTGGKTVPTQQTGGKTAPTQQTAGKQGTQPTGGKPAQTQATGGKQGTQPTGGKPAQTQPTQQKGGQTAGKSGKK